MMKKLFAILLATGMLVCLTACGGNTNDEENTPQTTTTTQGFTFEDEGVFNDAELSWD